jgi:hypothetical protein
MSQWHASLRRLLILFSACVVVSDPTTICPAACDPHYNSCHATTAPSCVYPDPSVSYPRAACACRPGYKANGASNTDSSKHWRLPIKGQDHRVWVAEGIACDTLCDIPYGFESCREVALVSDQCIGGTTSPVPDKNQPGNNQPGDNQPGNNQPGDNQQGNNCNEPEETEDPSSLIPRPTMEDFSSTQIATYVNSSTLVTYVITQSNIFKQLPLSIPVLYPSDADLLAHSSTLALADDIADAIAYAVPRVLEQYGIPAAGTEAVIDDIASNATETMFALFNPANATHTDPGPFKNRLVKRKGWGFTNKIGKQLKHLGGEASRQIKTALQKPTEKFLAGLIGDAFCTSLSAISLSLFQVEARSVQLRTPGPGVPIMNHQMYFLNPVYGKYPVDEGLMVHYSAPVAAYESYAAITLDKDIYLTHPTAPFGPAWEHNGDFVRALNVLVHEIRHTQQYKAHGHSLPSFGLTYTYQFCRAGFNRNKIEYERQAYSIQNAADGLMCGEFAYSFFEFWNKLYLKDVLGYPTSRVVIAPKATWDGFFELEFEKGVIQGRRTTAKGLCHRAFSRSEIILRSAVEDWCPGHPDQVEFCRSLTESWGKTKTREEICLTELQGTRRGVPCVTGN